MRKSNRNRYWNEEQTNYVILVSFDLTAKTAKRYKTDV